jgi:hypothetical protein
VPQSAAGPIMLWSTRCSRKEPDPADRPAPGREPPNRITLWNQFVKSGKVSAERIEDVGLAVHGRTPARWKVCGNDLDGLFGGEGFADPLPPGAFWFVQS